MTEFGRPRRAPLDPARGTLYLFADGTHRITDQTLTASLLIAASGLAAITARTQDWPRSQVMTMPTAAQACAAGVVPLPCRSSPARAVWVGRSPAWVVLFPGFIPGIGLPGAPPGTPTPKGGMTLRDLTGSIHQFWSLPERRRGPSRQRQFNPHQAQPYTFRLMRPMYYAQIPTEKPEQYLRPMDFRRRARLKSEKRTRRIAHLLRPINSRAASGYRRLS